MKMEDNNYEISCYTEADIPGIVAIENYLWGSDEASRREYFAWKHQRNPFLIKPVGLVARYQGKVVGFRGYVPVEWIIRDKKFKVLLLSDTVVHPDHRGKGLFSTMTKAGMKMYRDEYRYFVAFTANAMSMPGYLKLGWKQVDTKKYLRHFNLPILIKVKVFGANREIRLPLGTFGDIEVSEILHPADISKVAGHNDFSENKFYPYLSPEFMGWKLANPRIKYTYLYHRKGAEIDAYTVLRVDTDHAYVFAYGQVKGSPGIQKILTFIINQRKFSSISFFDVSIPAELRAFLKKKHFYASSPIERISNVFINGIFSRKYYDLPILVRPTPPDCKEEDWFVEGVDVREKENWYITEICFD